MTLAGIRTPEQSAHLMSDPGGGSAPVRGIRDDGRVASDADVTEKSEQTGPADGAPVAEAQAPPKRPKLKTARDMVLSMAVITAVSFGLYLFAPGGDAGADPVKPISYEAEADLAARAAPYALLAPEELPDDWRATSVRYRATDPFGATWKLGFVDPDNEYAGLVQANGDPAPFVADATQGAEDTGETVSVGGEDWAWYEGTRYDALVLEGAEVTTVVTGTAPRAQLTELAGSLRVRSAGQ